jgi:hypothetical protein
MLTSCRDAPAYHATAMTCQMSALGQKQTFAPQKVMSALPPEADMCGATKGRPLWANCGQTRAQLNCPLSATSRHEDYAANRSMGCGSVGELHLNSARSIHRVTSPFRGSLLPETLHIDRAAHLGVFMLGWSLRAAVLMIAIFDVFPARGPPDFHALHLRLACNGRLF